MGPPALLSEERKIHLEYTRRKWTALLFATGAADRKTTEKGIGMTYQAGWVQPPKLFLWFDDPYVAWIAADTLNGLPEHNFMRPAFVLRAQKRIQSEIRKRLGLRTWLQVMREVGPKHTRKRPKTATYEGLPIGRGRITMGLSVPRQDSLQARLLTPWEYHLRKSSMQGAPLPCTASLVECKDVHDMAREVDMSGAKTFFVRNHDPGTFRPA